MAEGRDAEWLADLADENADAAGLAALARIPEEAQLAEHLVDIWNAFMRLHRSRPLRQQIAVLPGGGITIRHFPGALGFEGIDRYAARFGYRGADFEEFARLIWALDDEYLKLEAERRDG